MGQHQTAFFCLVIYCIKNHHPAVCVYGVGGWKSRAAHVYISKNGDSPAGVRRRIILIDMTLDTSLQHRFDVLISDVIFRVRCQDFRRCKSTIDIRRATMSEFSASLIDY